MDNRWPRNEKTWELTKTSGNLSMTLPPDLNPPSIASVTSTENGYRLAIIGHENAEDQFIPNDAQGYVSPLYVSVWGGQMWLWPQVQTDQEYKVTVRGYTQPVWDNTASAIPDLDSRLHIALAYYAMALCYAQQEDEVLEGVYMARWSRDVQATLKAVTEPIHNHPLVLHGGARIGGVPAYVINPPTGV